MAGPAPTWADLAATWRVGYRRQGQRQADKSPCRAQERKQRERGGAGGEEVVGQVRSERKVLRTWCWGTMGGLAGTLRCQGRLREHVGGEGGRGLQVTWKAHLRHVCSSWEPPGEMPGRRVGV